MAKQLIIKLKDNTIVEIDMLDHATEAQIWTIVQDQFKGQWTEWTCGQAPVRNVDNKDYTIYRIDLDDANLSAKVWKEMSCSKADIEKEMRKLDRHVTKNNFHGVFVYREDSPRDKLVIPVL